MGGNKMLLSNTNNQNQLGIVYAHELAHLRGYSEVGAYATSAALGMNMHHAISMLHKHIQADPSLIQKFPKHLQVMWKEIFKKRGMDPVAATAFYMSYQKYGQNILKNVNKPKSQRKEKEKKKKKKQNDGSSFDGWGPENQDPPD